MNFSKCSGISCKITHEMVLAAFWDLDINPKKIRAEFNQFFELPAWERLFETMGLKIAEHEFAQIAEKVHNFFFQSADNPPVSYELIIPRHLVVSVVPAPLNTSKSAHLRRWSMR